MRNSVEDLGAERAALERELYETNRRERELDEKLMNDNWNSMKWQPQTWSIKDVFERIALVEAYVSGAYVLIEASRFMNFVDPPCVWVLIDPVAGQMVSMACDDLGSCMTEVESMVNKEYADINSDA